MSSRNYLYRQIFFRGETCLAILYQNSGCSGCRVVTGLDLCLVAPSETGHKLLLSPSSCLVLLPPFSSCCTLSAFSFFISFLQVFFGLPFVYGPVALTNTCFAMLSSLLLKVCPSQFHFLFLSQDSTGT